MNVLYEVETSWVIDHLHVLGTVRHFGEQKKKKEKKREEPHCLIVRKTGGKGNRSADKRSSVLISLAGSIVGSSVCRSAAHRGAQW